LARSLVAEVPELGQLGRRQIASLIGVAPHAHESGKFKGRRMIRGGRAPVRSTLYMAMLSASRCNPLLAPFLSPSAGAREEQEAGVHRLRPQTAGDAQRDVPRSYPPGTPTLIFNTVAEAS